jgi:hypothetical protein
MDRKREPSEDRAEVVVNLDEAERSWSTGDEGSRKSDSINRIYFFDKQSHRIEYCKPTQCSFALALGTSI